MNANFYSIFFLSVRYSNETLLSYWVKISQVGHFKIDGLSFHW